MSDANLERRGLLGKFNLDKSVAAAVNDPVAANPAKLHHPPSEIISIFLWFLGS